MNKFILYLFIFCGISLVSNAQKCKYDVDEKDKFTSADRKEKKERMSVNVVSTLIKNNEDISIQILYGFRLDKNIILNQGDTLMMRFEDGKVLKVNSNSEVIPVTGVGGSGATSYVFSSYLINYPLSKADIDVMSQSLLTDIKVQIGIEYHQQEVPSKFSKKIQKAAPCFK
jgi:hypothetical protein